MPLAAGLRFTAGGRVEDYGTSDASIHIRDCVVAQTNGGQRIAWVVTDCHQVDEAPEYGVLRRCTPDDIQKHRTNRRREKEALRCCEERVRQRRLPMKLVDAGFSLDGSVVTISFASETRVDFRELVRDVASAVHARVLFYQIGVRDHARMIPGPGPCGQVRCCSRFLGHLPPIAIRMAKDQSLSSNPNKFSGSCGKLMCCLRYEHESYAESLATLPSVGQRVCTPRGKACVLEVLALRRIVMVRLDDGIVGTYPADEVRYLCDEREGTCSAEAHLPAPPEDSQPAHPADERPHVDDV